MSSSDPADPPDPRDEADVAALAPDQFAADDPTRSSSPRRAAERP
ncbi:hypothetical protein ACU686_14685 [Yinghuangia aomiensis]